MGAKTTTFSFVPKPNEQIDTVITLEDEARSAIFGIVKDCNGKLVRDAVVKLFKAKDCEDMCSLKPMTHTFTDECGQFLFGPLEPGKRYVIKVWVNDVKVCSMEDTEVESCYVETGCCNKLEDCPKRKVLKNDSDYCDTYYK